MYKAFTVYSVRPIVMYGELLHLSGALSEAICSIVVRIDELNISYMSEYMCRGGFISHSYKHINVVLYNC